ncbi:MAG: helix-turn-helix transcriptional regulator [Candidatus Nitrohelix vancouverensis]|uniref:Helix-turn-helix transcriptional regulator n=1 Tax=Candidatus Nitrohelix vancouverensis TaxID=2705534 RepID=A0A7T0C168_9BACT|nr:MAG: helix-turn-helix transcriptional regulator [Candidatus Nitrohelix vancouverensis]
MGSNLDEKIKKLSKKRQKKIAARFEALEAEELTLRDLRKASRMTQKAVAKKLNISQDNVSRLESRSDVLLSTLKSYVQSLGGNLSLMAEFPDRPPVSITGFSVLVDKKTPKPKSRTAAQRR